MQHALLAAPEDEALRATEQRLLADRRVSPFSPTSSREVTWQRGFIRAARIHETSGFARLLSHPSARFLRELTIGVATPDLVAMLWDGPALPLRVLRLDDGGPGGEALDFDLGRKFPALVELAIHGYALRLRALPAVLQRLQLRVAVVPAETLAALARDPLPELLSFEIQTLHEDASGIARVLSRDDLPALRHFTYTGYDDMTICEALVRSPLAPQLLAVTVNCPVTGPRATTALVSGHARFASLVSLTVAPGGLDSTDLARLREAYGDRLRT